MSIELKQKGVSSKNMLLPAVCQAFKQNKNTAKVNR